LIPPVCLVQMLSMSWLHGQVKHTHLESICSSQHLGPPANARSGKQSATLTFDSVPGRHGESGVVCRERRRAVRTLIKVTNGSPRGELQVTSKLFVTLARPRVSHSRGTFSGRGRSQLAGGASSASHAPPISSIDLQQLQRQYAEVKSPSACLIDKQARFGLVPARMQGRERSLGISSSGSPPLRTRQHRKELLSAPWQTLRCGPGPARLRVRSPPPNSPTASISSTSSAAICVSRPRKVCFKR
jgi:hypothetical protein